MTAKVARGLLAWVAFAAAAVVVGYGAMLVAYLLLRWTAT